MRDSRILIMDEPTASLDPLRKAEVLNLYLAAAKYKTAIIVTHRLGSVRKADKIVVLKQGRVVEIGTNSGLLRRRGYY